MTQALPSNTDRVPWVGLVVLLVAAALIQVLLTLAAVIPYVGVVFQFIRPIAAFFIFAGMGLLAGEMAEKLSATQKRVVLTCVLIAASISFVGPYVAGYYTHPVRIARSLAEKNLSVTYGKATDVMKSSLLQETGSSGVLAYALYSERLQLSARSVGNFFASEFEDVDDLGGIIAALINTVLHAIPWLLKLAICDGLGWVSEAGAIGLAFWYLFSLLLTYIGFRTA